MNIKPKKSLGQNFLINTGILEKIVSSAELNGGDTVLEIGPGTGNLTKLISEKVFQQDSKKTGRVIAVEKDRRVIEDLKNKFPLIEVIEDDILKFRPEEHNLEKDNYKIVANIPYYITSNLLRTIFESASWRPPAGGGPKLIVLTVQKEVAKRIVAKPPDMNLLALSVQLFSEPKIIGFVSKGSFRPIPKVDSAIIKLVPNSNVDIESVQKILGFAKKAFSGKRKQLKNTLKDIGLEKLGPYAEKRPEELEISDWLKITHEV